MSLEKDRDSFSFDEEMAPVMALQSLLLLLLAVVGGVFFAVVALPSRQPA